MSIAPREPQQPELHLGGILIAENEILVICEQDHYKLPTFPNTEIDEENAAREHVSRLVGLEVAIEGNPIVLHGIDTVAKYYPLRPINLNAKNKDARDPQCQYLAQEDALLRYSLLPLEVIELMMQVWTTGAPWPQNAILAEDSRSHPVRLRSGAIVIDHSDRMLLIQRTDTHRRWYEIPGGGIRAGESPEHAALRELTEETGLVGRSIRHVATVFKEHRVEYYHVVQSAGTVADRTQLDLRPDAELTWVWIGNIADIPVWPKRLAWRLERWYQTNWPATPVELSDSILDDDLELRCIW